MPLNTDGTYVSPTWANDNAPAINAQELNYMCRAIQGAVEYDREMALDSSQKELARQNIGAASQADVDALIAAVRALGGSV